MSKERLVSYIPLLGEIYGINIEDNQITKNMDGQQRGENLGKLLVYLIQILVNRLEREYCAIILEDAHW
jgi:hypothetical protein